MTEQTQIDQLVAKDVAANVNVPPVPDIDTSNPDTASVAYSQHRTKLSTHRTALSEHRTELSTHRTDLSERRSEMSSRRTGLSFQRTRLSADRTLMSVVRTSLSLISFGFTIFQLFQHLREKSVFSGSPHAGRNFGLALVYLGVGMLVVGIVYHIQFMLGLRKERHEMAVEGLLHSQSKFPVSFTLLTALALLAIGLAAILSLSFNVGPFE